MDKITKPTIRSEKEDQRITLRFPYDRSYIGKIKTIKRYKWHPEEKYRSFPDSDGILEEILEVFTKEKIRRELKIRRFIFMSAQKTLGQ